MAERFMPGEDPIGRGFKWGLHDERPFRRVIGVVEDVRHFGLASAPGAEVYMPQRQYPYYREFALVTRGDGDAAALVPTVRSVVRELAPTVPLYRINTMGEVIAASVMLERRAAWTLGAFAVTAILLACIGLYGVLAYAVSGRRHEIGVRMALGARGGDVVRMVLRQGLGVAVAGLATGLVAAGLLSRAIAGALHGVAAIDPFTYGGVALLLLLMAVLATLVPARRATRIDPIRALRED
jgi:predicted lysophospholipase L1 biosynthesis ABC-type transport system permease subunit